MVHLFSKFSATVGMALHNLGHVLFSTNPEDQINFLKSKGLLRTQQDCPSCGLSMDWKRRPTCGDKFTWRCSNCNSVKSIRNGSFFSKSKLPLQTWLQLIHHWSMDMPVTQATKQAKISEKRCIDIIYQFMRDVCTAKLLATPIILGGSGTVVQIDESLFVHIIERYRSYDLSYIYLFSSRMVVAVGQHKNSGSLGWLILPQDLL